MNEIQMNKWEKVREKGKKHYIIFNGVIGWGIPTGVLFTIINALINDKSIGLNDEFVILFVTSMIMFPIGGILFGLWNWNSFEKNYQKSRK